MNYRLRYSSRFWSDLEGALRYITVTLRNPIAANALNDALDIAVQGVLMFPYAMPAWNSYVQNEVIYRSVNVKNYLAFYVVDGDIVEFRRFLLAASDLPSQLSQ